MKIKIFADGADLETMVQLSKDPAISGLTTNPTLMRKDGVTDYAEFAIRVLEQIREKPISFEVFADTPAEIERQARRIDSWADNVYVKIPVTTTSGDFLGSTIQKLSSEGIALNVTAVMTTSQVEQTLDCLDPSCPSIISVFAGRIADTGRNPVPIMNEAISMSASHDNCEVLWASPREFLNIVQADEIGCHIITVTSDLLAKLPLMGKDLETFSLETVKMFYSDATSAGYSL